MHVSNLYWNAPMKRLAQRLVERSFGCVASFFCNSGAEANEAALKLVAQGATEAADPRVRQRVPRTHQRRGVARRRSSPSRRRSRRWYPASVAYADLDARDGRQLRAHRGGHRRAVQGESGGPFRPEFLRAARARLDEARRALLLRRGADGHRPHRHAVRVRESGVKPDAITLAKGLGGGVPDRRDGDGPRCADALPPATTARRSRRPARERGRQRRARRARRRGAAARVRGSASGSGRVCASCRGWSTCARAV